MTELSRPFALDRVGAGGTVAAVDATPAECAAVALRLQVPSVGAFHARFRLRRIAPSVIEAEGELRATLEQVCVLTLEPFSQDVREAFTLHFVPSGTEDEQPDPDSVDQVPYEGNAVDLGEAAVEQLALTLDPYPRKPGATLPGAAQDGAGNPFAGLAKRFPAQ